MSSCMIFATKTHIFSGRRPMFRGSRPFKNIWDSPDTFCCVKPGFGSPSGHRAAISGRPTVTYAPVSTVTRYHLSPFVTRLMPCFIVMSFSATWGGLIVYAGVRPSPPALVRFSTFCHPSHLFLRCYLANILVFSVILVCPFVSFHHFSGVYRSQLISNWPGTTKLPELRQFCFLSSGERPPVSPVGLVGVLMGSWGYHYGMLF
jgi:hypothetical protein